MKLFLSADIEGTTGIALWSETENGHSRYPYFARQMTREVSAACEGATQAGCEEILIKDAHDSACNLIPNELPENIRLFRGWGSDSLSMMAGLDSSFDGVFFTGYHSAAGTDANPLAHTLNLKNNWIRINGQIASELMINSLTAAYFGVPVRLVTGDKGLCDWINTINPHIETVAVSEGVGHGSISIHPDRAVRLIREAAVRAALKDGSDCMFPFPDHFRVEINFKEHYRAKNGAEYPGSIQVDTHTVAFETPDYLQALKFIDFVH
ncbi:MAG: M55 family metallopeptidase [Christensenellales bacterium]|nr:M55 family metallopeptidase [Christensenellales bacterium]